MQRWFASIVIAGVFSIVLASAAAAQIQVQAQPVQGQGQAKIQVQIQVQAQPAQIQPGRIMQPPVMNNQPRMMQADAIFAGRVVAMEPMDIEAEPAKGQAKVTYRIATVEVTEAIHGLKKDTKMIRVAFLAQPNNQPAGGGGGGGNVRPAIQPGIARPGLGRIYNPQMTLQVGQDGMFAVNKHFKENFFLAPNTLNFISRENNQNFETELKTAKQLAKVMGDPAAALKAEDKQDRYLAAAILVSKYRANQLGTPTKGEPIDAAESKLILQAIAGGDWTNTRYNGIIPNPVELFRQLGVNGQPNNAQGMQKWLDENAGKYVIQKLVADPNAKAGPSTGQPNLRPGVRPLPIQIQPAPAPKQN
jgi:hypothetical protein